MGLLEYVISMGGVAGVLAFFIFKAYRCLVGQMRDDRKYMEDRLTGIINEYNSVCHSHTDAMLKHTQALTELIIWLKSKNGHS